MDKNKVMLVTGASRGIGRSIVTYFVKLGYDIIVTYYSNKDKCNDLIDKYTNITAIYLDLKEENSIKELANYVKEKYGKIDVLINNAAISMDSFIMDKTKIEFMKVLEINTVGTFLMMKYFDDIVDGYIFNISSTDGIDTGSIYSVDYNASKAGINSITKTFSLFSKNKVISICPNWVDTDSTKEMNEDYLESELRRINQDKLIDVNTIPKVIERLMKEPCKTGSIIRIEGDFDA